MTLFLSVALTACGGGGGGGGGNRPGGADTPPLPSQLTYSGVITQAALNAQSSPVMAGALLFELGFAEGGRPLPASQAKSTRALPKLSSKAALVSKSQRRTIQAVSTDSCAGGGSVRIDDRTNDNGTGTITLTYQACVEGNVRTEGSLVLDIAAYDLIQDEPTNFVASFHGYSETTGDSTIEIGGSVRTVSTPSSYTQTYNTVTRYRPENVQYRLQDMVVRQTLEGPFAALTVNLQGRIYHSALGYADVTTDTALVFDESWMLAESGTLRMQGSGAASIDVTFTGLSQIQVALDENGDGTAERSLCVTNLSQLGVANHWPTANAGPDVTINEGQTVTLTGSGTDWEGDPLSFQWAIEGGPYPGGVIGTGTQMSFRPTVPGSYLIQLRVSDGQPFIGIDSMTLTVLPNADPVARAGADVSTVEGGTVVLDGGASTDAENDPIEYSWTRVAAPAGSTAPATVNGQSWNFVPDRPGTYEYRLRAADATGASFDNARISASYLAGAGAFSSWISIDPTTTLASAQRVSPVFVSGYYSGPPVPLNISTNVPWLTVVSAPATTQSGTNLVVGVVPAQLALLDNGTYTARITVSPAGYTASTVELALNMDLPKIEHVTPYVAYENDTTPVTVYGTSLRHTLGGTLLVNGAEVQGFTRSFATYASIELPALAAGEYELNVRNNLGIERSAGRFVVRQAPTYPNGEFDVQGRIESIEYDAERDVFYAVTWDLDYGHAFQAHRLRYDGAQWLSDPIPVTAPQAVSLNVDGTRLYVTQACSVTELDPVTLSVLQTNPKPSCFYEIFGMISGLADGRVLVADTNQWPTVFNYPAYTTVSSPQFPSIHNPVHLLNHTREWLLWAESPSISGPRGLYLYDVAARSLQQIAAHDPDTYFLAPFLGISGDGRRFIHSGDVYEAGQYIGSLQRGGTNLLNPALTHDGERAVVFDPVSYRLSVYDLTSGPSFPLLTDVTTVPDPVSSEGQLRLLPNDSVAFLFTTRVTGQNSNAFRVYVRNLP